MTKRKVEKIRFRVKPGRATGSGLTSICDAYFFFGTGNLNHLRRNQSSVHARRKQIAASNPNTKPAPTR